MERGFFKVSDETESKLEELLTLRRDKGEDVGKKKKETFASYLINRGSRGNPAV
jgi:hypothetical protein